MRLLITGASGFIGAKLGQALAGSWHVTGTYLTGADRVPPDLAACPLDVRDAAAVAAAIERIKPDAIVHTAAVADLRQCKQAPGLAQACNVEGARSIARCAHRLHIPMMHLSTDLVFDGQRGWYSESDTPAPICSYGVTKLAGERAAQEENPDTCILRLALSYGTSANQRRCFLERMLDALRRREQVPLFVDEHRTPVFLDDLCATVEKVLAANLRGVFHVACSRRISRYELGVEAAKAFGLPRDGLVSATRASVDPSRPADCSLLPSPTLGALGCAQRDPTEALAHMAAAVANVR